MVKQPGYEGPPKLVETWDSINKKGRALARQIRYHSTKTGETFSKAGVIPKGGLHQGSTLPEPLGFTNDQLLFTSIQSYKGQSKSEGGYLIGQMPSPEEIENEDILLFDEVWETGGTLDLVKKYYQVLGANIVRIAVLHYKPTKNRVNGSLPDFYAATTDQWVDYPWEQEREMLRPGITVARPSQLKPVTADEYIEAVARRYGKAA